MSICKIIEYLSELDISYTPSNYIVGPIGPIGVIGKGGIKVGPDPLRESICLIIKLKKQNGYWKDTHILDTIYETIEKETNSDSEVLLAKSGNHEMFKELMEQYEQLELHLDNLIPINISKENLNKDFIKKSVLQLGKALELKTSLDELNNEIKSLEPTIRLYCRTGTQIYESIRCGLYHMIKH